MGDSKLANSGARRRPPAAGIGRKKGVPNKITREIKQMVIDALSEAGGVDYLVKQAEKSPTAFLALVGKVIPLQLQGSGDNGALVHEIRIVGVQP